MLGLIWWPMIDQLDWDGALTHRIGKIHQVGLWGLSRQKDGTLTRSATPLVRQFRDAMKQGDQRVGKLEQIAIPAQVDDEQLPPLGEWDTLTRFEARPLNEATEAQPVVRVPANGKGHNGNGHATKTSNRFADAAPGLAGEPSVAPLNRGSASISVADRKETDKYGIVVFSHLRGDSSGNARSSSFRALPRSIRSSLSKSRSSIGPKAASPRLPITA